MLLRKETKHRMYFKTQPIPEGITIEEELEVESVIETNRETFRVDGTIKQALEKIKKDGVVEYYDVTKERKEITEDQYNEVRNSGVVSVRNYRLRYCEYEGLKFRYETIGNTDIKLVRVPFATQEEKDNFVAPSWLGELFEPTRKG